MILEYLTKMIADAGIAVPGQDLFEMSMPATQTAGIVVKTPLAGVPFDIEVPHFYKTALQIIVRDADYDRGSRRCDQLFDLFASLGMENRDFESGRGKMNVRHVYPVATPIEYPRQESNGFEWSINLRTAYSIKKD